MAESDLLSFTVPCEMDGITVKNFLRKMGVSARLLAQLKRTENGITKNGSPVRSIDVLTCGDTLILTFPESSNSAVPVAMPLDILYEDCNVIAVNKPPSMPVHPSGGHLYDTLANAVAAHAEKQGEKYAFRAVNRLDKDTSGIVLMAKNRYAAAWLSNTVAKSYIALCEGIIYGSGTISAPIGIKPGHTVQREVSPSGESAVTHYRAVKSAYGHTALSIVLDTGRTHQIRVHFSSIGHPLAGDDMYGGSRRYFSRQCLHCAEMSFLLPFSNDTVVLNAQSDDWLGYLESIV